MCEYGARVIATRPDDLNSSWCERIAKMGVQPLAIPFLGIQAVEESNLEAYNKIKNQILSLDHYNKLIFISQNAVRHGFQWIDNYWTQYPIDQDIFAIGKKTADSIRRYGTSSASHFAANDAMNSEQLLALPKLQKVSGEKVLIFRGVDGRTHLGECLRSRGAVVEYCELYFRIVPGGLINQLRDAELDPGQDVLSVFSGETLVNGVEALKSLVDVDWWEIPVLVPGKRVAEQAKALGFKFVSYAENATEECMSEKLKQLLKNQ